MPNAPTPNLGMIVPTVGGDFNNWGGELNADLAILDNLGVFSTFATAISVVAPLGTFPETMIYGTGGVAGITVTIPAAASVPGKTVLVKKMDATAGRVNVQPIAGLIDGFALYELVNQYQYVRLNSDGLNWNIVGNN
jgi:hypothetical protein